MEKATSNLGLVCLSKQNFRRTLDSLQDDAHSLLRLSIQWKEIEGYFDSTKTVLEEKAKELQELEESLKSKEKEFDESLKAKLSDLEKKEKEKVEELESLTKRVESMEKLADEKCKELDESAKVLELKVKNGEISVEFEPLVSFLAKNMSSNVTVPTNCPDFAALSRLIPYLDPAKIVLDALEESFNGESNDRFDSFILLLEKLIETNPKITRNVKEAATQLGIDWLSIAKTNPNNHSIVLGCLMFLVAYGLAHVTTTREVLLNLLEPLLSYDHAPKLFRLLGLEDKVSGVVETLRKKEQYFVAIKFICEFPLFKLSPGALLLESLNSSERSGSGNSMEAHKARKEKIKADAIMALEYIKEKKLESKFPLKAIKNLIARLERNESPVRTSDEKAQSKTNNIEASSLVLSEQHKAKRQRVTEAITPIQNSTVNQLGILAIPSGEKTKELKATYPLSTETKPNIGSDSINADMLRELLKKQPLEENDLSNALKSTQDSAKLVLHTSMALYPTNTEGSYEFKLLISSESCSLLFDQLKKLPLQNEDTVREEAKKLAVHWKYKVSKRKTTKLEVVCFLKFLGIFGVVSEFKANDLLALLDSSYWRTVSPDLCKFLGLENDIPDFIQSLIKTGQRFKAIDYIYSFDMVQRFQPVSAIINDALRITKETSEKSFKEAMNKPTLQVAALDKQIKSLRAALECISFHKLQSEFQLGNLKEQIKSLLKLRSQAGSVITMESSKATCSSKRNNTKRGEKRSVSGNIESSVQVSSVPSNHFADYDYPWNQSQTWPVNHLAGGFAGAPYSNYNAYQRTQPEQPQLHLHQHLNPFYRNYF